jgi:hypothetical protein
MLGKSAGPHKGSWANDVIDDEIAATGKSIDSARFKRNLIMYAKHGNAEFDDPEGSGGRVGWLTTVRQLTLPFKDSSGNIVPRSYFISWFANDWDPNCGGAERCTEQIDSDSGDRLIMSQEALRAPIRQALATW